METKYDVLGIGNAIVDVLHEVDDDVVSALGVEKGAMVLVDEAASERLLERFAGGVSCSGGSAANSMVGFAALGGRAAYIGRVRDDALGRRFAEDLRAAEVAFDVPLASDGPGTAHCLILVTPDAQRTMHTYLGACARLSPLDVDDDRVAGSRLVYLEGYLWDPPPAKEAFLKAARVAHESGRRVALSLSDAFCVDRHRESFLEFIEHHVDVLFANETEICSLYREADLEVAARHVRDHCGVAALTRGAEGAILIEGDRAIEVGIDRTVKAVDSTGAGDLYAGGLLFGMARGYGLADAGKIGAVAAGEVVSHVGARPTADLARRVLARLNSIESRPRPI